MTSTEMCNFGNPFYYRLNQNSSYIIDLDEPNDPIGLENKIYTMLIADIRIAFR